MHFIRDHTPTLSAFLCGRTQHVRCMRSSIVRVFHSVFSVFKAMQFILCCVMLPRTAVIFRVTPLSDFQVQKRLL